MHLHSPPRPTGRGDWMVSSARWLWLAALPLAAGLGGRLTPALALALGGWAVVSLARAWAWGPSGVPGRVAVAGVGADLAFAVLAIALSGNLTSPLWSGLLVGALGAGWVFGVPAAAAAGAAGVAAAAAWAMLISPQAGVEGWGAVGLYGAAVVGASLLLGWLAARMRAADPAPQDDAARRGGTLPPASRSRQVYKAAADLSAAPEPEGVLDLVLDLSAAALAETGSGGEELISAVLVPAAGGLRVAAARRLSAADLRQTLALAGALEAVARGRERQLCLEPGQDPELQRLEGLRHAGAALCLPLETEFGAATIVFAHPSRGFFTAEIADLLQAVAQQATAVLRNARRYQDLEREKERITEMQEEARRKLARDLHDGPTQAVAAIAMRANYVRRLMERDTPAAAAELNKLEDLARRTTKEIRHMLFTMRPLILESQGLVPALRQLAEKVHDTHEQNILVEGEAEAARGLQAAQEAAIFYVAEEAINNARKHAEAAHIWVRLHRRGEAFVLEVRDDGVGFNVGAVDSDYAQRGSLGMVTMRERSELIGGTLRIESSEGQGTAVVLTVPIPVATEEAPASAEGQS